MPIIFFSFSFSSLLPPSFNWNKLDHRIGEVMLKDALVNSQKSGQIKNNQEQKKGSKGMR
jgi:hypothetical protein